MSLFLIIYLFHSSTKINELNNNYVEIQSNLNLNFSNNINKEIRIAIYTVSLSDGGLQRITSILINYLYKIKIFKLYLFNQKYKEKEEYKIPDDIKRIVIEKTDDDKYLINKIIKNKIDIFIYQFPLLSTIKALNNLKNIKVIFFIHSNFFYWLYAEFFDVLNIYKEYQNSKYIISLLSLESDYLFKKWGINSILFENFLTYDYNSSIISSLSSNTILLIGRGRSKLKRFELGIQSMEYIVNEIPDAILNIVSKSMGTETLISYINNLNLRNNIKFVSYFTDPSIYFKKASLNFLTSASESFSLVLSETKIYGIPNIILGLDYVLLANNGTIMIYDDLPETVAKASRKILFNKIIKKKLSNEARISMKKFNNDKLYRKWIILLLSIFNNKDIYKIDFERVIDNRKNLYYILKNQLNLLNHRVSIFKNITIQDIENIPKINITDKLIKREIVEQI